MPSDVCTEGVFDSSEDTRQGRKPNETAVSPEFDCQCHQFSTQPDDKMIM